MPAHENLSRQFSNYTLMFKPAPEDDDMANHAIVAQQQGQHVGKMEWDIGTGDIVNIEVHPNHRRKGIATAMWNQAQDITGGNVGHSETRSDDGEAWAQSVGGDIPKRFEE